MKIINFLLGLSVGVLSVCVFAEDIQNSDHITFKYDYVWTCSKDNQMICVELDGKFGIVDTTGNMIAPIKYDYLDYFLGQLIQVKLDGKYGFINRNGNNVIPIRYDSAYLFWEEDLATVKKQGKWGLVNSLNGKLLTPIKYDYIDPSNLGESFDGNIQVMIIDDEYKEKYGFINTYGQETIPPIYDFADDFHNGITKLGKDNEIFYFNRFGEEVKQQKTPTLGWRL